MKKRFLSLFLVLCMLITCMPTTLAADMTLKLPDDEKGIEAPSETNGAYNFCEVNETKAVSEIVFTAAGTKSVYLQNLPQDVTIVELFWDDEETVPITCDVTDNTIAITCNTMPANRMNNTGTYSSELYVTTSDKEVSMLSVKFTDANAGNGNSGTTQSDYTFYEEGKSDPIQTNSKNNDWQEITFSSEGDTATVRLLDQNNNVVSLAGATLEWADTDNDWPIANAMVIDSTNNTITITCTSVPNAKNYSSELYVTTYDGVKSLLSIGFVGSGFYYLPLVKTNDGWAVDYNSSPSDVLNVPVNNEGWVYIALYFNGEPISDDYNKLKTVDVGIYKAEFVPNCFGIGLRTEEDGEFLVGKIRYGNNSITIKPVAPEYAFYADADCTLDDYVGEYALTQKSETVYFSEIKKTDTIEFSCNVADAITISSGSVTNGVCPVIITPDGSKFAGQEVYLQAKSGNEIIASVRLYAAPQGLSWRELEDHYEIGDYRTDPCLISKMGNRNIAIYYTNENGEANLLSWSKLEFSEGIAYNVVDDHGEYLNIRLRDVTVGSISYEINNAKYVLRVQLELPEFGFYSSGTLTAENYIEKVVMKENGTYTFGFDHVDEDNQDVNVRFAIECSDASIQIDDIVHIVAGDTTNKQVTIKVDKLAAWPMNEKVFLVAYAGDKELESLFLDVDNGDLDTGDAEGLVFWLEDDLNSENYIAGFAKTFTRENDAFAVPEFSTLTRSYGEWDANITAVWDSFYFVVAENSNVLPKTVSSVYEEYFDLANISYVVASDDGSTTPTWERRKSITGWNGTSGNGWDGIRLCTKDYQVGTTWEVTVTIPLQKPIYVLEGSSLKPINSFEWSMTFVRHNKAAPAVADLTTLPGDQSTYELALSYIEMLQTEAGYRDLKAQYPELNNSGRLEIWLPASNSGASYEGDIVIDGENGLFADVTLGYDGKGKVEIQGAVRAIVQSEEGYGLDLENLHFIGAGKNKIYSDPKGTLYNYGISGRGEVRYENCKFEDFYIAIYDDYNIYEEETGKKQTRFGSHHTEFVNNHIAVYLNAENADGNSKRTIFADCRFEKNDCAIWIKSLNNRFNAYEYGVDNCQFIDNGMDIVYEDDKMLFFPCNFFGETDANGTIQCVQPKVDATWNNGIVMFAAEAAETELMLSVYPIFDSVDMKNLIVDAATTSFVMQNDTASSMAFVIEEREQDLTIEMVQQGESDGYTTLGSWNIAAKE